MITCGDKSECMLCPIGPEQFSVGSNSYENVVLVTLVSRVCVHVKPKMANTCAIVWKYFSVLREKIYIFDVCVSEKEQFL